MAITKRPATRTGRPRARKGVKLKPTDLGPAQLKVSDPSPEIARLAQQIEQDGGAVLSIYREPLGGHVLVLAALPVDKVQRTAFQRDVSDAHVRKLTVAMDKTRRYLDPIIALRRDGAYVTPNGGHRLTALQELGARSVPALVVPEAEVAYQILALNIEKAHNLREKALEVMRMYRDLGALGELRETDLALEFEEPALITLGFAYDQRGRLAGGAYHPALRRVDGFQPVSLQEGIGRREQMAGLLLTLDDAVTDAVTKLKQSGLQSPYLRNFVVARINPLRFIKGDPPSFESLMATMTRRASGLDPSKVKKDDLARSGGPAEEE